jgi:hypothetical protein
MEVRTTRISGLEQLWIARARSTEARQRSVAAEKSNTEVRISQQADLLKQMAALKQNDPERFKEVVGAVAQNLTAAAQNPAAGDINADLSKLARSLDQVAKSGDLGKIEEPAAPRATSRAIEAYLKNARPPQPSDTARQAIQYVLNTIAEANQGVQATEATGAAG